MDLYNIQYLPSTALMCVYIVCVSYIRSFNPHSNSMRWVLLLLPSYREKDEEYSG